MGLLVVIHRPDIKVRAVPEEELLHFLRRFVVLRVRLIPDLEERDQ